MNLMTFLGAGKYERACYAWGGQELLTSYAPAASAKFLAAQKVTVFVTAAARESHLENFCAALTPGVATRVVDIPEGKSEDEFWQIFRAICEAASPEEETAFDVTHGFRSLPMLGLTAAAFLRSSRRLKLRAVLYGAYEARETLPDGPPRVPVFDLSGLVGLLDWSAAADRFLQTGDSRYMARLLDEERRRIASQPGMRKAEMTRLVTPLTGMATGLRDLSASLALIRPEQAIVLAESLEERVSRAREPLEAARGAAPFGQLLEQVEAGYRSLGRDEAEKARGAAGRLAASRRLIAWYAGRERYVEALALAREWLVNWQLARSGVVDWMEKGEREKAENVLNNAGNALRNRQTPTPDEGTSPIPEAAVELWTQVTQARNDCMHAGYRRNARSAMALAGAVQQALEAINQLDLPEEAENSCIS